MAPPSAPISLLLMIWPLSQSVRHSDGNLANAGRLYPGQSKVSSPALTWENSHWSIFYIRLFTQLTPNFRVALVRNVKSSSYIRNFPNWSTVLRNLLSMTLVRQSASIMAVDTQRHWVCSLDCSFSNMTSMVVLHSWQFGTAVLVIKSYSDLQSVIIKPRGSAFKEVSGWDQSKEGFLM